MIRFCFNTPRYHVSLFIPIATPRVIAPLQKKPRRFKYNSGLATCIILLDCHDPTQKDVDHLVE